jgi:hypothetical protein
MKRIYITAFFIPLLVAGVGVTYIEKFDNGFIISIRDNIIDPIGEVKLAFTRVTRDCSGLAKLTLPSTKIESMKRTVDGPTADEKAVVRAAWTLGNWAILETDFVNREPAIFLLEGKSAHFKIRSVYGGTAAPFNDTQFIHEYFKRAAPNAPLSLVNCYEPVGPPFDRASK